MKSYRGIINSEQRPVIHNGCWKLELGTKSLSMCPGTRKMLGLRANQELNLRGFFKLLPHEQLKELICEFKHACATNTKFEVQVRVSLPNGKTKWFRISGVPYFSRWESAEEMIGVMEDTTQMVNEECLSFAIVNHELSSPLTVIKLNVQLLMQMLSAGSDKHPLRLLQTVDLHINSMTRLIEEYLNSPVNDLRHCEPNKMVFCMDDLINTMITEMKMLYPGYRFVKQNDAKILVKADKYKIVQVLINYLTNAVSFSPQASRITISSSITCSCVEIAVRDQGIGIPAGQERLLFEKFYQGDSRSLRRKNSKGLGLYLVKKIISEHQGKVRAEKGGDGGSVFYFSLPVYQGETNDNSGIYKY
jgi:two-component system sensor histidine kinase VicK